MPARHRSRQRALQVLFLWDQRKQTIDEAIASFYETLGSEEEEPRRTPPDEFMDSLVRGTAAHFYGKAASSRSGEACQPIGERL